jgi:hypothetical protein
MVPTELMFEVLDWIYLAQDKLKILAFFVRNSQGVT